jgi:LysM repeat protein
LVRAAKRFANLGKLKHSTNEIVDDALAQQAHVKNVMVRRLNNNNAEIKKSKRGWTKYWFPILCAIAIAVILICTLFSCTKKVITQEPGIRNQEPETIIETTAFHASNSDTPRFDLVRVEKIGSVIISGRWKPNTSVSISANKKILATLQTDERGEFQWSPVTPFAPGNYNFRIVDAKTGVQSADNVFVYVSGAGYENSMALLMNDTGSRLLQYPTELLDGDLVVSKIDYLKTGRIVVTGNALPRLRTSLSLDGEYVGFARVSDHKHFGLGADVGELTPGRTYKLDVKLHDASGNTVSTITHTFTMPEATGHDDTYYTVRRGDALWIIARNFMGRGILFSMIVDANNIENPDLIFPEQILNIPVKE